MGDTEASLTGKARRNALKAQRRKEENRAITVMCIDGHVLSDVTVNQVNSWFPDLHAVPHTMHTLDVASRCKECIDAVERKKNKEEAFQKRKQEKAEFIASKKIETINHHFRPDQGTRVTLHNVFYVQNAYTAENGATVPPQVCKTSFYGKVRYVDLKVVNGEVSGKFVVNLFPRKDLSFANIIQLTKLDGKGGLRLLKNTKGFCTVEIDPKTISSKNENLRLGSNPEKCPLMPIEVLGPAVLKKIATK